MNMDQVLSVRNTKTVYRDGDTCVKIFEAGYSKADVLNEALNQARIEELGLNIPKILSVHTIEGKWAIVSEFIKGKTLAELMSENPEKKDEYLALFVELQTKIHANTCPQLHKLKDKMNQKIYMCDLDATTRFDLHNRLDHMPRHNKVCHGDFNPSNIIITEDEKTYIVDWSHVTQGNASADAARSYLLFYLHGDLEAANKYLELFCEKTHTQKEYVQEWLPIVAASQSVKGNAQERDTLLSFVNGTAIQK